MTEPEMYYRYEDRPYSSGCDEWGDPYPRTPGTCVQVICRQFEVLKHTPTGAWLNTPYGKKFVSRKWTKQFALPTKGEAMQSFIARKQRQLSIYRARIKDVKEALRLVHVEASHA